MPLTTAEALDILRAAELPCFSETWPETVHAANGFRETPLHVVAVWGRIDLAEALLAGGAEINRPGEQDYTALHEAIYQGKIEMVRWLLAHGADPHLTTELGTTWELASYNENSAAVLAVLREL